jgi:hypothetical protein
MGVSVVTSRHHPPHAPPRRWVVSEKTIDYKPKQWLKVEAAGSTKTSAANFMIACYFKQRNTCKFPLPHKSQITQNIT